MRGAVRAHTCTPSQPRRAPCPKDPATLALSNLPLTPPKHHYQPQASSRFVAGRNVEYLAYCRKLPAPEPPPGLEVAEWRPEVGLWRDQHGGYHLVRQDILRLANDAVYNTEQLPPAQLAEAAAARPAPAVGAELLAPLRDAAARQGLRVDPFETAAGGKRYMEDLMRAFGVLDPNKIQNGWRLAEWEVDLLPPGAEALAHYYGPHAGAAEKRGFGAGAPGRGAPPSPAPAFKLAAEEVPFERPAAAAPLPDPRAAPGGRGAARAARDRDAQGLVVPDFALRAPARRASAGGADGGGAALRGGSAGSEDAYQREYIESLPARQEALVEAGLTEEEEDEAAAPPPPAPPPDDPETGLWVPALRGGGGAAAAGEPLAALRARAAAGRLPWGVTVQRQEDGLTLPLTQVRGRGRGAALRVLCGRTPRGRTSCDFRALAGAGQGRGSQRRGPASSKCPPAATVLLTERSQPGLRDITCAT